METIESIVRRIAREEIQSALSAMAEIVPQRPQAPESALLDVHAVSELIRVAPKTLYNWQSADRGPRAIKVGRNLRWRADDVERWVETQSTGP
ncbi:helix-turn-helix transcriptional regulator [Agromyces badenianii]|uniref:helix-turn-helix transcriptional regulator n=1 Tax=Agromyces badenianii TaxID=2080742 RepID=UPI000D59AB7E|nr:helix-turn-helix domain-containing protein [Agromyces badenianii]PWC05423.1 hypothetical protein DCE94_03890 [Agromyces badenianii]